MFSLVFANSNENKKCLSVGNFGILSVVVYFVICSASTAYISLCGSTPKGRILKGRIAKTPNTKRPNGLKGRIPKRPNGKC